MSEGINSNSPQASTPNVDSRQQVEGNRNQTIGQVYGGMVVYVSGGRAIFNPSSNESSDRDTRTPESISPNPYMGLLAFHEDDSEYYFGRSREIDDLWNKLRDIHETEEATRLLPIYGPSGSGKSSLARAGLIPELGRRPLPGRDRARVAVLCPGTKPIQALATVLARIATDDLTPVAKTRELSDELMRPNSEGEYDGLQRIASVLPEIGTFSLMVLVDQFEEIYTLCEKPEERDAFIANLLYAAKERTQYVTAIVTFRNDFLGETHKHPALSRLFTEPGYLVSAMDEEGLREAIATPAEKAGHPLNDATIHLLIEQTEGRVGALPLLQFALTRIWENLPGKTPAETLEEIGGVGGALAGEAQRVYESLSEPERAIARRVFLGLVQLGEGTRDTRRRVGVDRLTAAQDDPKRVRQVMDRFAAPGVRLISLSTNSTAETVVATTAEVTHEALFEHWQPLNEWLDESREDLRFQRRLEEAAEHWDDRKRPGGLLWRRPDLDLLRDYYRRFHSEMTALQVEFYRSSVRAQQRQQSLVSVGVGLLVLFAAGMAWFGLAAQRGERLAIARQLAAKAEYLTERPEGRFQQAGFLLTVQLSSRFREMGESSQEVNQVLLKGLEVLPAVNFSHEDSVNSVAISADGKRVISGSFDGTARLWDAHTGKELATLFHEDWVWSVAISADGKRVISGSGYRTARLWDAHTGEELVTLSHERSSVSSVALSADGKRVISGSRDGTVRVWDADTGREMATLSHGDWVTSVAISADGKRVISGSGDGTMRLWDANTGEELKNFSHKGWVTSVAISTDGERAISGSLDGTARLWDADTGEELATLSHGNKVTSVAMSADGKRVISGSEGTARLWDADTGEELATLSHESSVYSVAFSADGQRVISGSDDGTARLWDADTGRELASLSHEDRVTSVAFSADGKRVISGSRDGTARLWDADTGEELATLSHGNKVTSVAISADGKRVISRSEDRTVWLWLVDTDELVEVVCSRVSRNLTAWEWETYLDAPLASYELSCPERPVHPSLLYRAREDAERGELKSSIALLRHLIDISKEAQQPIDLDPETDDIENDPEAVARKWSAVHQVQLATEQAREGNVQQAIELYKEALAFDSEIDLNPDTEVTDKDPAVVARYWAVPARVEKGRNLARQGDIEGAIAAYTEAQQLDSDVDLNPDTEVTDKDPAVVARSWAATAKVEEGRDLAQQGDIEGAISAYTEAQQFDSDVDLRPDTEVTDKDPKTVARSWAAPAKIEEGRRLARQGDIEGAMTAYTEAQQLNPTLEISAQSWNTLCWNGSLYGFAAKVMDACEKAVAPDLKHGGRRDSRGLARALTGDMEGAIEDFQVFVGWTNSNERKAQRQQWIDALHRGENPFTDEVLKELRDELPCQQPRALFGTVVSNL